MPNESDVDPICKTEKEYGNTFNTDLLEQYKLYVQSAEKISSSRIATSRYLLTLNAALLALYGFRLSNLDAGYLVLVVPVTGVLVSVLWYMMIQSYRNLNTIKFQIIHKLEGRLPAALFRTEWDEVERRNGNPYRPVTKIEQWLPLPFLAAHVVLAIIGALDYFGMIE